jgi:hypothetical protein
LIKKYVDQITPEQVIKIYAEDGVTIAINQAGQIIEFLYMITEIALDIAEEELHEEKLNGSNTNGFEK